MSESNCTEIVGIDVGGANLKYASSRGHAHARPFPMWRHPHTLAETIVGDLRLHFPACDALAVTMTGELADCFLDRSEGVRHIVEHVCQAAKTLAIDLVRFYGVDGKFRSAASMEQAVDLVAAANWHALASHVAREIAGEAVLVDIGSTTTDIIPIAAGCVATEAKTDHDRLRESSLVYVGCRRTPVCALVNRLCLDGQESTVMNELFATIDDARIVLDLQRPCPEDLDSADGKPRTVLMAANRLARMIGLDRRDVSLQQARELASQVLVAAKSRISDAIFRVAPYTKQIVLSGHGYDLLEVPTDDSVVRLVDHLGEDLSRCAPSYAVVRLYQTVHAEGCG